MHYAIIEPKHFSNSMSMAVDAANDILEFAGIQSTKDGAYKDQMAVLGVLGSTELYFLQDNSPEQADTRLVCCYGQSCCTQH